MNAWLAYALGLATPFAIVIGDAAYLAFRDWLDKRRYQRAWDRFGEEFDALTPGQLEFWRAKWRCNPCALRLCDDRARYFAMRWENGRTEEA